MNENYLGPLVLLVLLSAVGVGWSLASGFPALLSTPAAREVVRRVTGLVAILAAILLGFGIVALESTFNDADHHLRRLATEVVELDSALARLGPAGVEPRQLLFRYTAVLLRDHFPTLDAPLMGAVGDPDGLQDALEDDVDKLGGAGTPSRSVIETQALLHEVVQTRWAMEEHLTPMLQGWQMGMLMFWLMVACAGLGVLAPRNRMMAVVLGLGAVALAGAVFLLAEFDNPFQGVITISGEPLLNALHVLADR